MYVCICHAVTDKDIERAVDDGARRLRDLSRALSVATRCGRCAVCAHDCLKKALAREASTCPVRHEQPPRSAALATEAVGA